MEIILSHTTMHALFEEQTARTPDRPAVIHGRNRLTYHELNESANRLARYLQQHCQIIPDEVIGIQLKGVPMLIAILAVLKAGGTYAVVKAGTKDMRVLLTAENRSVSGTTVINMADAGVNAVLETCDAFNPENRGRSNHPAAVLFSAERCNGARVSHSRMCSSIQEVYNVYEYTQSADIGVYPAEMSVILPTAIFTALWYGHTLHLLQEDVCESSTLLSSYISEHQLHTLWLPPAVLAGLPGMPFPALQVVFCAGEPIAPQTGAYWAARLQLFNCYVTAETGVVAVAKWTADIPFCIGTALAPASLHILDTNGTSLPAGIAGELCIGGPVRYTNKPTDDALPFRTGDRARRLPDGRVEWLGKMPVPGQRMNTAETEARLNSYPGIRQAVVVGGDKQLTAYYLSAETLHSGAIMAYLRQYLPAPVLPAALIPLQQLPVTPHGKTDRHALAMLSADKGPAVASPAGQLLQIWQEVLGQPHLRVTDGFSASGGNSLLAVSLMSKMKKAGFPISLREIYHHQTIAALLEEVLTAPVRTLLQHPAAMEKLVTDQAGARCTYKNIFVKTGSRVEKRRILQLETGMNISMDALRRLLWQQVSPEIYPDFISTGSAFAELPAYSVVDEKVWAEMTGQVPLETVSLETLQASLNHAFTRMDEWVKAGIPQPRYPLGAIQQMQISFKTPASTDAVLLPGYVDLPALQQAARWLIARHGLLRSIAVKEDSGYCWQEYETGTTTAPDIAVIDLSGYHGSSEDFHQLVTQLMARVYETTTILCQFFLIKIDHRTSYLAIVCSHVIFDRATGEVMKSQLLHAYQHLLEQRPVPEVHIVPFETYVRQLATGPQQITETAIMQQFALDDFFAAKQLIRTTWQQRQSTVSHQFNVVVPLPPGLQEKNVFETALTLYARAMQEYLGTGHIPVLFVSEGRQYENQTFYNTVGECNDMVPLLLQAALSPAEMARSVTTRLEALKKHNLHFLHLLLDPRSRQSWPRIGAAMDAGEQFAHFDMLMFNFLGNKDDVSAGYLTETITVTPLPLPVHTLLNCITAAAEGHLVYMFRCSHETDIPRLRTIFRETAANLNTP